MGGSKMSDLSKVVVLAGGLSHERDVSLRSGRRVALALRGKGVEVLEVDPDNSLLATLQALKKESGVVVFPTLHGAAGEDGSIRDVLEIVGIPYVGSRPDACRRAFNKPVAKGIVASPTTLVPQGIVLPHSTFRELGAIELLDAISNKLGMPLMVKPTKGGSSLGATLVRDINGLPEAMISCFAYGNDALIEEGKTGTEIAVSIIDNGTGPRAFPAVEIVPDSGSYSYEARYTAGLTEFFVPARISDDLAQRAADVALDAHNRLGLRDISRTDLIIDEIGGIWFLEVNLAPGMTETSLLPQSVEAAGLDVGDVYLSLATNALKRSTF
jgi:D-alanine-D-alanine ligase